MEVWTVQQAREYFSKQDKATSTQAKEKAAEERRLLVAELDAYLELAYPGDWVSEYHFKKPRRWRFDRAIPSAKIALEIEGGIHSRGRHTRGKGYQLDLHKYNQAVLLEWTLYRFSYDDLKALKYREFL